MKVKTLGLEEHVHEFDVRGCLGARVPDGIDLDELGVPARFEDAVDFRDDLLPLGLGEGEDEEALIHETELGGPVGGE